VPPCAPDLSRPPEQPAEPAPGETVGAIIDRLHASRANGSPLVRGDLPYARALRGEIVG